MTGIVDYTTLQAAVVDYLARDQDTALTARIPTLIQLVETKANRKLFVRQMEQRSTAQTDPNATEPEYIALPNDFQSMRRMRITAGASNIPYLQFKSNQQMDEFKLQSGNVSGEPQFFTIFGSEIELGPTPDGIYTIEMIYRQNIPPLATNSTNWLLTLAPDFYLYGTLLEATAQMKDDPRIAAWGALFAGAMNDLNDLGKLSQFNAGPLTVRPSGLAVW
jgi:hypothetical protein